MPKKTWVYKGKNPDTGKKYFSLETVNTPKLIEPPSIDELPPPGAEGIGLTKEKPLSSTLAETPETKSIQSKGEKWFPTFIEMSQTTHDKEG